MRDQAEELSLVHRPPLRAVPRSLPTDPSHLENRLREASRRWSATTRELDVLRALVVGDANKEIATKLSIHVGSVERHTTSLLRKARCDSRSRLIARFWSAW